jgi:hypothetical protein
MRALREFPPPDGFPNAASFIADYQLIMVGQSLVSPESSASRIWSVRITEQYSPSRFARLIAWTSSAVRHTPRQSRRPKVNVASSTGHVLKPRFPAILTVASTELLARSSVSTRSEGLSCSAFLSLADLYPAIIQRLCSTTIDSEARCRAGRQAR